MAILDFRMKSQSTIQSYILRLITPDPYGRPAESDLLKVFQRRRNQSASVSLSAILFFHSKRTQISRIPAIGKIFVLKIQKNKRSLALCI